MLNNKLNSKIYLIKGFILLLMCCLISTPEIVYAKSTKEKSAAVLNEVSDSIKLTERGGTEYIDKNEIYYSDTSQGITFDEELLNKAVDNLQIFKIENIIESKNPKIAFEDGTYAVREEIYGTQVNKDLLKEKLTEALKNKKTEFDLASAGCYIDPVYKSTDKKVEDACSKANKMIISNITYKLNPDPVNAEKIKSWIHIDGNYNVTLNRDKVRDYVTTIAQNYTYNLGRNIYVSGGENGNNRSWYVDIDAETDDLIKNIENGQTMDKSPVYGRNDYSQYFNNIGDTFIEIDLSEQYIWYFKNGYIAAEGSIVTGNASKDRGTPVGVYSINAKQTNTTLIGKDYKTPVNYWMPFIGNAIGLHDAVWRGEFGGEIYKYAGSHGCVNLPYKVAENIYNQADVGTIVICHN